MGTPLDPKHNHRITLEQAAELTKRQRDGGSHRVGDSAAFNAPQVIQMLSQAGCVGMRYYLARNAAGETTMVLVGVDEKGNDMESGILLDSGLPCPPFCPDDNALNS